jgi:Outer membrane protein and related peptidoglycan-associated (lipo)proteins
MHIKTAAFAMLLAGVGCSHAQTKPDQNQAQAFREPQQATKRLTAPSAQSDDVATNKDSRAAGEAIYFDFDSALLRNEARPELQKVAQEAKRAKAIRIEGNCDERGTTEFNLALGDARARSAATYLERLGVRKNKISTVSYGSERPKVPGHDESAWSQNRRDDFKISTVQ